MASDYMKRFITHQIICKRFTLFILRSESEIRSFKVNRKMFVTCCLRKWKNGTDLSF